MNVDAKPNIHAPMIKGLRPNVSASLPAGMCVIAIEKPNAPKMNPISCLLSKKILSK
jgi:hypothetical protein